ncbi:MAG: glutamate mutase L [Suipraeoptans sp.]
MQLLKNMTVLSEDEIYQIHMNVMEVLWQVGILVEEKESLQLLEKNGAKVDYEKMRAYLPADLIQHALDVKGHSCSFYDTNGNQVFPLGGNKTYYGTCGYSTTFVDSDGISKEGTYKDSLRLAKLIDTIDEVSLFEPSIQPCDMPPEQQDLYLMKSCLVGTGKPIHSVANSEKNAEAIIHMNAELVGGLDNLIKKPKLVFNLCTFSPLGIRKDCCEVVRQAAKYNIPCMFSSGPMAGATAPVTLAGTVVESFAEVIGHTVLAQCYKPGLPVSMLSAARIFDMKYAACTVATPEYPLIKIASCQMANFYKIPIGGVAFTADSNEFDMQHGSEKFMNAFISRQAGMNMEFGMGMFSQLNQFSFESLVFDAEMVRSIERIGRGIEVNDFSLAYDIMEEEGVKAEFLFNDHTTNNYKKEFLMPDLTDRVPYANYLKRNGKNTLMDRAHKRLEKYEKSYDYTKGLECEEKLQKIIDEYSKWKAEGQGQIGLAFLYDSDIGVIRMKHVITIDFGSTFTKVVVVNLIERRIILSSKVPSTVGTNSFRCLEQCFELVKKVLNEDEFRSAKKLASSSAAGGLRMSVIGLTESLSTLGGKAAALGAGAKIIANYSGFITDEMIRELENSRTEIVLLCGGYERGNTSMVLSNANKLAHSKINVPIIYAGNSQLCKDVRRLMRSHYKTCYTVENIIPEIDVLNVESTQEVIRSLFLDHIIDMKGFQLVKQEFDDQLIPTPVAVLEAGTLLNKGTDKRQGMGPLLIVDIGGATTDVYSFNENKSYQGAKLIGLEEPFGKRTVEGDLGMRESSGGVAGNIRTDAVAQELRITEEQLRLSIRKRMKSVDFLPDCEEERKIDNAIATAAVHIALRRHAGRIEPSYNEKNQHLQYGKNITDVSKIIGTGGILVYNDNPPAILKAAEKSIEDKGALLPETTEFYLDKEYILFSAGLLKAVDEDAALEIMLKNIKPT